MPTPRPAKVTPIKQSGAIPLKNGHARPRARSGFVRDLASPFIHGWQPIERDPIHEYSIAQFEVRRRAIDAIQNSGWLAGGVEQATTQICGSGLALNARPDVSLFVDRAAASAWARDVERRFTAWANAPYHCDLAGRQSLSQICHNLVKGWFGTGEIVAVIRAIDREGVENPIKVQPLPSVRLVPRSTRFTNAPFGVVFDDDGLPLGYCIQNYDANGDKGNEVLVRARDETGRPVVIHVHDSPPTVVRGLTPLAPALLVVRQFDQLANATLTAALIQSIFAATIESDAPTEDVMTALQTEEEQASLAEATEGAPPEPLGPLDAYMQGRADWYENTKIDLGLFGKVVHMFMGEKLNFLRSEHPNSNYKSFSKSLLQEIAKCLGITYEQLTGDREGATYSSERMGTAENWPLMERRRKHIAGPFVQSVYENWLEAEIELGTIVFPGGIDAFVAQRHLVCMSDWRGPPKPTADDSKTAKANETLLNNKLTTREQLCAELGLDYYDVFEQLKQEQDEADELGVDLSPPPKGGLGGGPGGGNPFGGGGASDEEETEEREQE
jgi:lambda family phage portal protein